MTEKVKVQAKVRPTKEQEEVQREVNKMNTEMEEHFANVPQPAEGYTPFAGSEEEDEEQAQVLVKHEPTLTLTADDLAKIVAAAKGDYLPFTRKELPPDASFGEKMIDFTDDAMGEVGRGAHRMIDGCRDILAGAVDIVTLGRARRR